MQQTIKSVKDTASGWNSDHGPMCSVEGEFTDGSLWANNCKPENAQSRIDTLKALIGQPGEFELVAKKEYQGKKQWGMKSYPGKVPFGGGYGGSGQNITPPTGSGEQSAPPPQRSGYQVRFRDTEEGFLREQRSIHRSVALEHAAAYMNKHGFGDGVVDTIHVAAQFYAWLSQDTPNIPIKVDGTGTIGQAPTSEHPLLDELKDRFGMESGADLLKGRAKYSHMIQEAVKAKNAAAVAQGGPIGLACRAALEAFEITQADAEALYDEVMAARRVLQGGT